jgi:hypothetical protein
MSLDKADLTTIVEADLQALIDSNVPEGRDLDYKVATYGGTDEAKREFLADVSSFANTSGGHLIIGMEEVAGVASALPGVDLDPDAEIRRLDSLARDGLQPRLPEIRLHAIRLANTRVAIVVRVGKSWSAPHRIIAQRSNRFWARGAGGKYEPDVNELRSLFAVAPTLSSRIRDFRMERVARIAALDTPIPILPEGALVLHIVPFTALSESGQASIDELYHTQDNLRPMAATGFSPRINLDGVIVSTERSPHPAYVQIWRDRRIESIRAPLVRTRDARRVI